MQLMTIKELASASGWPPGRIRQLIRSKKLPHLRMDGLTLLPADAIDEFTRQNMVKPENSDG
jgi:excisionase family DNA binding protein